MGCSSSKIPEQTIEERIKENEEKKRRSYEKMLQKHLDSQKKDLRTKSLPNLERRSSCDNLDLDVSDVEVSISIEKAEALERANNLNRRRLAKIEASKDQKWMILSQSDVGNDSDMSYLAEFMKTVMNKVHVVEHTEESLAALEAFEVEENTIRIRRELSNNLFKGRGESIDISPSHSSENITLERRESSKNNLGIEVSRKNSLGDLLRIDNIVLSSTVKDAQQKKDTKIPTSIVSIHDFDLPSGHITSKVALSIIDNYKKGGRLSVRAVHKILRLSYRSLKSLSNTSKIAFNGMEKLNVVGDIHGQLQDLLFILEDAGIPSVNNKYIFNGDFVDRGPKGVEVMCILLALHTALPEYVFLNRGNHEDYAICCAYGFQKECCDKYDDVTFGMFVECFHYLPLFTVVNDSILVVHGGLFHTQDATLNELNDIARSEFSLTDIPETGEDLAHVPRYKRTEFLQQLARDALWSDPQSKDGFDHSPRGAGVAFGPDITKIFLKTNKLNMIVRSHECVRTGFNLPFEGADSDLLCTIFSASNYCGGANAGAYMVFSFSDDPDDENNIPKRVIDTDIYYHVCYFNIEGQDFDDMEPSRSELLTEEQLHGLHQSHSMYDNIKSNIENLMEEFKKNDDGTGFLSKTTWAEVMEKVLVMHIKWLPMVPVLVLPQCCVIDKDGERLIDYEGFLNTFTSNTNHEMSVTGSSVQGDNTSDTASLTSTNQDEDSVNGFMIDALYAQHKKLEAVFRFFDKDCDGIISKDELIAGCNEINLTIEDNDLKLKDFDRILRIINIDESGEIDVNEFFEMYRLSSSFVTEISALTPVSLRVNVDMQGSFDGTGRRGSMDMGSLSPTSVLNRRNSMSKSTSFKSYKHLDDGLNDLETDDDKPIPHVHRIRGDSMRIHNVQMLSDNLSNEQDKLNKELDNKNNLVTIVEENIKIDI